ncbi:hypothetical protein MC885_013281 [Smutsia gigantea]|nr:hypothetical protein MC885_013281 [Smutsia gigantea]
MPFSFTSSFFSDIPSFPLIQDQLAADMYNFMAKEGEYGKFFVTLLEAQADYHRKALAVLEKALPEMRAHQDKWAEKPAFGTPLEEHLKRSGREIALPIEACVMLLLGTGMKEEDQDKKLQDLWRTCQKLPPQNFVNFRYLIKFLAKLAQTSDINKMTPSNIAIVLGPNLLWAKNEGFGVKLMDFQAHRRGGTLNRKHISPAFQPPLPPTDGSTLAPAGAEPPPQSSRAESSTGGGTVPSSAGTLEQGPSPGDSPPKPKDSSTASAPASGRNNSQMATGQNQAQTVASSHQLSVGQVHNSAGPSPHTLRRAPPKPGNPPPGHPGSQNSPGTSQHPPGLSPKPSTRSPSPPSQHPGQVPGQSSAPSQLSAPRRYSSSLSPIQAPSHPPPQPPMQAAQLVHTKPSGQGQPTPGALPSEHGLEQPSHTPPQTPTPPSTPPLGKQNSSLSASQTQAVSNPETAQPHTGTLPRPRPVPKPRNRPSVPPPPQPPGAHSAGDGSLPSAAPTASKIVTDSNSRISDPLCIIFPELHSDSASKDLPGHLLLEIDNDTESTAL